jgi:hypothetical protein
VEDFSDAHVFDFMPRWYRWSGGLQPTEALAESLPSASVG